MSNDKECFVISPIGAEDSETRERADKLLEHVIKDAVEDFDYETVRADKLDEPGKISTQVIQHTANADLVIADLTGENPNVFYELAIRHAANEPFIQIIEKGHEIPFDIYDQRTIKINIQDLDSVEECKSEIKSQIENIESGDFEVESPVTTAANLQFWENSGDPKQQELADIIEIMTDMRNEIGGLRSDIENFQIESNDLDTSIEQYGISPEEKADKISDIQHRAYSMEKPLDELDELFSEMQFENHQQFEQYNSIIDHLRHESKKIVRDCSTLLLE